MTHPLIPTILELATPVASSLNLEVVGAVFHTNQHPPVLRVDIRNLETDTGLDDCERMSRALEATLDMADLIPDTYVLEISSPGISRSLSSDREFISFRGFDIIVETDPTFDGHQQWIGKLVGRDVSHVSISQKGRTIKIPRDVISQVLLYERRH
jgi:ribosome maturation factor RimP